MADDKLLVAKKSFITSDDDGKRVVVRKGKSRYRASHPLAKKFPSMFRDADNQPVVEDTRSAPVVPTAPAAKPTDPAKQKA
jgi:hypothetical protein